MFNIIEKVLSHLVILSAIQNHSLHSKFELEDDVIQNDTRIRRITDSAFIMSREMQSSQIVVASQSIIENVLYSNVRVNRRSFMFDA